MTQGPKEIRDGVRLRVLALAVLVGAAFGPRQVRALEFPGPPPGIAEARLEGGKLLVGNGAIRGVWNVQGETLGLVEVADRLSGAHTGCNRPKPL